MSNTSKEMAEPMRKKMARPDVSLRGSNTSKEMAEEVGRTVGGA